MPFRSTASDGGTFGMHRASRHTRITALGPTRGPILAHVAAVASAAHAGRGAVKDHTKVSLLLFGRMLIYTPNYI